MTGRALQYPLDYCPIEELIRMTYPNWSFSFEPQDIQTYGSNIHCSGVKRHFNPIRNAGYQ